MASLTQIHKLENRYPFNEEEMEILLRCHRSIVDNKNDDSFLMKLAMCSPYSYFFLPGNEMRKRINLIEDHILPQGFSSELRSAIATDAFVDYANEGEEKMLERFLEGVADTGRRGPREALRVIYDICNGGEAEPHELVDLCFRFSVASEVIVTPNINEAAIIDRVANSAPTEALARSLSNAAGEKNKLTRKLFIDWADASVPLLASTLSTFVHNLIFHGRPYPPMRTPYIRPELHQSSEIFENSNSPLLFSLACMTPQMGGKWHRLYSSESDGRSFNRLEWSLLGYDGPTLLVIKTDQDATLGAFAATHWKESGDFQGNADCFLFQLEPTVEVCRPIGKDKNYMYCNPKERSYPADDGLPHGMGFGGWANKPRLFIPESFDECTAGYLDSTYKKGDLLPKEALEKFNIKNLEVWGVGGDEIITKALRARAEYREVTESSILKARKVTDKKPFLSDLESGLIDMKMYKHREQARGRAEFRVDEEHGGYKLERE